MFFPWTMLRAEAALAVMNPDAIYWVRYYRRRYSELFNTPLPTVEKLDFSAVYTNVVEKEFEGLSDEARMEYISELVNPDGENSAEDEALLQEQIKQWEKENEIAKSKREKQPHSFADMPHANKYKPKKPTLKPVVKKYEIENEGVEEED